MADVGLIMMEKHLINAGTSCVRKNPEAAKGCYGRHVVGQGDIKYSEYLLKFENKKQISSNLTRQLQKMSILPYKMANSSSSLASADQANPPYCAASTG